MIAAVEKQKFVYVLNRSCFFAGFYFSFFLHFHLFLVHQATHK
jgi:hypothetical protein